MSNPEIKAFEDVSFVELVSVLSGEELEAATEPSRRAYVLPAKDAHISFNSPFYPSGQKDLQYVTFLRMYDFERDTKGYTKSKDVILNNSTVIFEDSRVYVILDKEENDLEDSIRWVSLSKERTALFSAPDLNSAPKIIRDVVIKSGK